MQCVGVNFYFVLGLRVVVGLLGSFRVVLGCSASQQIRAKQRSLTGTFLTKKMDNV